MNKLVSVNRLEVIDWTASGKGREFIKWVEQEFDVYYDVQDNGRTVKIFIQDQPRKDK